MYSVRVIVAIVKDQPLVSPTIHIDHRRYDQSYALAQLWTNSDWYVDTRNASPKKRRNNGTTTASAYQRKSYQLIQTRNTAMAMAVQNHTTLQTGSPGT
jgi:hypothetical protein